MGITAANCGYKNVRISFSTIFKTTNLVMNITKQIFILIYIVIKNQFVKIDNLGTHSLVEGYFQKSQSRKMVKCRRFSIFQLLCITVLNYIHPDVCFEDKTKMPNSLYIHNKLICSQWKLWYTGPRPYHFRKNIEMPQSSFSLPQIVFIVNQQYLPSNTCFFLKDGEH